MKPCDCRQNYPLPCGHPEVRDFREFVLQSRLTQALSWAIYGAVGAIVAKKPMTKGIVGGLIGGAVPVLLIDLGSKGYWVPSPIVEPVAAVAGGYFWAKRSGSRR